MRRTREEAVHNRFRFPILTVPFSNQCKISFQRLEFMLLVVLAFIIRPCTWTLDTAAEHFPLGRSQLELHGSASHHWTSPATGRAAQTPTGSRTSTAIMGLRNPLGFTKLPVTVFISLTYIALFAALICVHHIVPEAPSRDDPVSGVNLTAAWHDLQILSNGFHPYNSRRNDEVRNWLLTRVEDILEKNGARYHTEAPTPTPAPQDSSTASSDVVLFNDLSSNTTTHSASTLGPPLTVYFEGTNIIVWIKGDQVNDENVLVNAHYDSVSTGFGATDDGVGVVSILQLISHYTVAGNKPKRGLVALFNNGEEDYLNGARAFLKHPIARTIRTFVNLEGAGAGGRAAMFRSTDAEVTEVYKKVPYPFGTSISADAFQAGIVRSQTDYVVFNGDLGARGLDIAFMAPRARYHTTEDSTQFTSRSSLWHMLSAAIVTTQGLTSDMDTNFDANKGSPATWFDVFGVSFGIMKLQELFALSVTMLVVPPLVLLATLALLTRLDKCYLFAMARITDPLDPHTPDEPTVVKLGGWKGFTRLPIAFLIATGIDIALALALPLVNPLILYSSPYSVWVMFLSIWLSVAWFFLRGASFMRPSALHRAHALGWIFVVLWAALVAATIFENEFHISGIYPIPIFYAAAFLALELSYLEFLALPKISKYVAEEARRLAHQAEAAEEDERAPRPSTRDTARPTSSIHSLPEAEPTETTSLLSHRSRASANAPPPSRIIGRAHPRPTTRSPASDAATLIPTTSTPFPKEPAEQRWSKSLPSTLWILEFLVLAPVPLILLGQIALFLTSALHQTPADGNPVLPIYLQLVALSAILLLSTTPFLHRFNRRIPLALFLLAAATAIYNFTAFPFSEQARLKLFFQQRVDVDTGANTVSLTGLERFVQAAVADLPSAAAQTVHCHRSPLPSRRELTQCTWPGLAPAVVPAPPGTPELPAPAPSPGPGKYADWLSLRTKPINATAGAGRAARLTLRARESRACQLRFDAPVHGVTVHGAADAWAAGHGEPGTREVRLWRRDWDGAWTVDVAWDSARWDAEEAPGGRGLEGQAVCLWSDANDASRVPALQEVGRFAPRWAAVSKLADGLVEASVRFVLE